MCKLKKGLYGLKQGSRTWNKKLSNTLLKLTFIQSKVYVDDILLITNSKQMEEEIIEKLEEKFKIRNLGEIKYCLGINIARDREKLLLDQATYIDGLLERYNMKECNPVNTPLDANQKLNNFQTNPDIPDENTPYQELVGAILYANQMTRPDVSFASCTLSMYNKNSSKLHWKAAKRVLRYLNGTKKTGIEYHKKGNDSIIGYSDADWGNDNADRKSITGYIFMFQGGSTSWCAKKQPTVALSTITWTNTCSWQRLYKKPCGSETWQRTWIQTSSRNPQKSTWTTRVQLIWPIPPATKFGPNTST